MTAGVRLVGLEVGDDPETWRAAGFVVDEDGEVVLGGVTIKLRGSGGPRGLLGWALHPPVDTDLDGLASCVPPPRPAKPHVDHPNGASLLDHVVVLSDDVERTTIALSRAGIVERRTVRGVRGDGDDDTIYRFFLLGTCVLELVGPASGDDTGTESDDEATPARFTGLAITTTMIDDLGELASSPRDAVQPGRRIATLRTEPLDISVPIALLTPRQPRER